MTKWTTGGSNEQARNLGAFFAAQTLPEGAMFAINGIDWNVLLASSLHDHVTCHDEGFFVGERDGFSGADSGKCRPKTDQARAGSDEHIGFSMGRDSQQPLLTGNSLG